MLLVGGRGVVFNVTNAASGGRGVVFNVTNAASGREGCSVQCDTCC